MKKTKFNGHFDDFQINYPIEGQWVPCVVKLYCDGIEIELWKQVTHENSVTIHKKIKDFDFKDMLLMNDCLNKIYGRPK